MAKAARELLEILARPGNIVGGILRMSTIDYPDVLASVLFFNGCTMKCPYCHNARLADGSVKPGLQILDALKSMLRPGVKGVVFTGGEPTLSPVLGYAIAYVHQQGRKAKLDTNGITKCIENLAVHYDTGSPMPSMLPDYVALDVKFPKSDYGRYIRETYLADVGDDYALAQALCGVTGAARRQQLIDTCLARLEYNILWVHRNNGEYRTTVHRKLLPPHKLVQLNKDFMADQWDDGTRKPWYLQQFRPCDCWDKELNDSGTYSDEELADLAIENHAYVRGVREDLVEKVRKEVDNQSMLLQRDRFMNGKGVTVT